MAERAKAQAPFGPDKSAHSGGEPIDHSYLARFTCGNTDLEREVLQIFAAQTPLYVEQLREAAGLLEWKETAHTIKGSAMAVGARNLTAVAQLAERLEVEADPVARDHAIVALATAADEVCAYIACRFATP